MRPWYSIVAQQRAEQEMALSGGLAPVANPWMLTNPAQARVRRDDSESVRALVEFWNGLTDLHSAFRTMRLLRGRLVSRHIRYCRLASTRNVPWSSIYSVQHPVVLDRCTFVTGDRFTIGIRRLPNRGVIVGVIVPDADDVTVEDQRR